MTWEVRQDPRDPNAWDVYEGEAKVAHLPWCSRGNALKIAAANELLEVAEQVLARATIKTPRDLLRLATVAIAKAEGVRSMVGPASPGE